MITLLQQAEAYKKFAQEKCQAHRALSRKIRHMHACLAILVVSFATSALFIFFSAQVAQKRNALEMAIAGLLLILAAILVAVLVSFRLSAVTERHNKAVAEYDAISYRLGMFLIFYPDLRNSDARHFALKEMNDIIGRIANAGNTAPYLPGKTWENIKANHAVSTKREKIIPFVRF